MSPSFPSSLLHLAKQYFIYSVLQVGKWATSRPRRNQQLRGEACQSWSFIVMGFNISTSSPPPCTVTNGIEDEASSLPRNRRQNMNYFKGLYRLCVIKGGTTGPEEQHLHWMSLWLSAGSGEAMSGKQKQPFRGALKLTYSPEVSILMMAIFINSLQCSDGKVALTSWCITDCDASITPATWAKLKFLLPLGFRKPSWTVLVFLTEGSFTQNHEIVDSIVIS